MNKEINVSYGYGLKEKDKNNIIHKCMTSYGSSGAPILNLSTNKVIGIHKSFLKSVHKDNKEDCYNLGTLLKYPLRDMNKQIDGLKLTNEKKLATIKNKHKNKNLSSKNIMFQTPINENKIESKKEIFHINKKPINQRLSCINNNNYKNEGNDNLKSHIINKLQNMIGIHQKMKKFIIIIIKILTQ